MNRNNKLKLFSSYYIIENYVNRIFRRNQLKKKLYESENFQIEYWTNDCKKPKLLLLPAFAADAKYSWFRQVSALSKYFQLIIPNLQYFGNSKPKENNFSISKQVEAIADLLSHLQIKEVSICGASYGAIIAAELGLKKDLSIKKLVLTNAPFLFDQKKAHYEILETYQINKKSDLLVPDSPKNLKRLFNLTYYRKPPIPNYVFKNLFKHLYQTGTKEKKELIEHFIEELDKIDVSKYRFTFPVLLLWGAHDKLVSESIAIQLNKELQPESKLVLIPKTAHLPGFERPKLYNKYLLDFLKE